MHTEGKSSVRCDETRDGGEIREVRVLVAEKRRTTAKACARRCKVNLVLALPNYS